MKNDNFCLVVLPENSLLELVVEAVQLLIVKYKKLDKKLFKDRRRLTGRKQEYGIKESSESEVRVTESEIWKSGNCSQREGYLNLRSQKVRYTGSKCGCRCV